MGSGGSGRVFALEDVVTAPGGKTGKMEVSMKCISKSCPESYMGGGGGREKTTQKDGGREKLELRVDQARQPQGDSAGTGRGTSGMQAIRAVEHQLAEGSHVHGIVAKSRKSLNMLALTARQSTWMPFGERGPA